jgi:oxygen-independent coproporphyrinogen III oxidase
MIPRSLYIHVPFCARRCSYCDFAVEALRDPPVGEWLDSIIRELELTAQRERWSTPLGLDTLYVGGGTPSLLGRRVMSEMLERLAPYAELKAGAEWTCEANPESFTQELAHDWKAAGVNRISLGAQSFQDETLRWMGRLHGADGPERALGFAREAGFDNVSLDLIFGLPERLNRDWEADLEKMIELGPEHVSLYGLTAEAAAPLGRWVQEGREKLASEDRYADEYLLAHRLLTEAGYEHYEVSNFGRAGRRSRHNFVYWTGAPYAALGPGAHSYFPPMRRGNLRSWYAYRDALAAGELPFDVEERIDPGANEMERLWLGLRTSIGLDPRVLSAGQQARLERWIENGLAQGQKGLVRLTCTGWLLLDELTVDLYQAGAASTSSRGERVIDRRPPLVQIAANTNPES